MPKNLSAQPSTFPTPDARVCINPSSPTIGEDLGWVSTNGARGGGGGGEEALPVGGGGFDGDSGSDEGVVGSGPK